MTVTLRRGADNIHAVLIEKDGRLVYEQYFAGMDERHGQTLHTVFSRDTAHHVRSVTKSVVSALVGAAIDDGAIRSVDQPIIEFFPEHANLSTPEWRKITIRDVLTMSAGIEWDEVISYSDPRNDEVRMNNSDDPVKFVLERKVVEPSGTRFNYSGGLTYLLGIAVQRATGKPLAEYAKAKLFEPLGITRYRWFDSRPGVLQIASGLILRPRDLAKFGSVYLNRGRWNGQQVLPESWVSESTRRRLGAGASVNGADQSSWAWGELGYGYQWWHTRFKMADGWIDAPTAAGNGEQRVFVVPALQMVVTINAGRYNDSTAVDLPERLMAEQILPALRRRAGSQ